ncbi:DUF333 domain-containing protein [Salinicola corii]|uniref:DUF333 domain-containing protein n=1 Tax=Salinicola corii TaxID=2606937 RepID=A0A640WG30_9GAMM|nr:DUF333 domain-containing protein [Salinicola corii]KAA0019231.1 DUF333 domain-containing protein [Salinicola corii]
MQTRYLSLLFPFALVACSSQQEEPKVGMPNPASVYCEDQGGTLEIQQTKNGQVGMCTLPDGTQVEEWDLYRKTHAPG